MKPPQRRRIPGLEPLPAYGNKGRKTIDNAGEVGANVGMMGGIAATVGPGEDAQSLSASPVTFLAGYVGRKVGRAIGKGVGAAINLRRNIRQDLKNKSILRATGLSPEHQEILRREQFYK
jgi:hypothetical protein